MKYVHDILLDESGDVMIKDGDLCIGESTQQHARLLLLCQKGGLKLHPLVGVGVHDFLNNENPQNLKTEIRRQFKADSLVIKSLQVGNKGTIDIKANYK